MAKGASGSASKCGVVYIQYGELVIHMLERPHLFLVLRTLFQYGRYELRAARGRIPSYADRVGS